MFARPRALPVCCAQAQFLADQCEQLANMIIGVETEGNRFDSAGTATIVSMYFELEDVLRIRHRTVYACEVFGEARVGMKRCPEIVLLKHAM